MDPHVVTSQRSIRPKLLVYVVRFTFYIFLGSVGFRFISFLINAVSFFTKKFARVNNLTILFHFNNSVWANIHMPHLWSDKTIRYYPTLPPIPINTRTHFQLSGYSSWHFLNSTHHQMTFFLVQSLQNWSVKHLEIFSTITDNTTAIFFLLNLWNFWTSIHTNILHLHINSELHFYHK